MIARIAALALAAAPRPPCWGDGHNHLRSRHAVWVFKHAHPCPGGPDKGSHTRCRGYDVDHRCALACCGKDVPENMQWMTHEANEKKGDDCSACGGSR